MDPKNPPWGNYDFSKKSLAVISVNKNNGIVLWTVGGHVRMEMEEAGLYYTEDLGLTPPDDPGYLGLGREIPVESWWLGTP